MEKKVNLRKIIFQLHNMCKDFQKFNEPFLANLMLEIAQRITTEQYWGRIKYPKKLTIINYLKKVMKSTPMICPVCDNVHEDEKTICPNCSKAKKAIKAGKSNTDILRLLVREGWKYSPYERAEELIENEAAGRRRSFIFGIVTGAAGVAILTMILLN
jgi:hypothetical protein